MQDARSRLIVGLDVPDGEPGGFDIVSTLGQASVSTRSATSWPLPAAWNSPAT